VNCRTLVKEFQDHVTEYKSPVELIDNVVAPYSEVWDFVRQADFEATEHAESINDTLSWLNRVDFKDWVPPAILYFKRFRNGPALLNEFFQALERLTYFMLVTRVGINDRIETFASLTKEIEPASFDGGLTALTTLHLSAKQQREFIAALDGDIYRRLPKARMALMLRLEALVSDGSKKQTFDHLSLEHVLPQTPPDGSEWTKWFPDEVLRDAWTHRLANLVPLHIRKNPSASNFDFDTKKNVYFKGKGKSSPFILTNEARAEALWEPDFLDSRQKRLVGVLSKHWQLDLKAADSDTQTVTAKVN
jgi:hypothetical protein